MKPSHVRAFAIGYIVALPILLLVDVFQYRTTMKVIGFHHAAAQSEAVLYDLARTFSDLKAAESAAVSYVSNGEPSYLKAYQDASAAVRDDLQRHGQASPVTHQSESLLGFAALVTKRLDLLQQGVDARTKMTTGKVKSVVIQGRDLMPLIQQAMEGTQKETYVESQGRDAAAQSASRVAGASTLITDALGLWLVAMGAMIIHRYAADRQWKGMERRLHTKVLYSLPLGICLSDDHGVILYTNPAADEMFGYDPEELIGKNVTMLNNCAPEENARFVNEVVEYLGTGRTWRGELVSRKKNGSIFVRATVVRGMDMSGKTFWISLQEELQTAPQKT
jgi:PAS domain S-box-containing protein